MNLIAGKCMYAWALLATAAVLTLSGASDADAAVGVPDREADPVVLTGSETPALVGIPPKEVVAFRWDGAWKQVPVQVDERKIADFRVVRQLSTNSTKLLAEVYADPGTFAGADGVAQMTTSAPIVQIPETKGDPTLDVDDEITMMARDAGSSAAGKPNPSGVDGESRTPVRIKDPLNPSTIRYLYLFEKTANIDPANGTDYLSYAFRLTSGDYKTTYDWNGIDDQPVYPPANPETSSVQTPNYSLSFPGRWLTEGLTIRAGAAGSAGIDILDGDKATVGQAGCGRNELTFSRGGGGFIANIDGPVRGIRSFIGANSGTYTQRDLIFYDSRFETNTTLRVHAGISSLVTAMDYSEAAKGMTYRNSLNPEGVEIDGIQDEVTAGKLSWEQVSGTRGSLTNVARLDTDMPNLTESSFYMDESNPSSGSSMLCSGDDSAFGASGPWVTSAGLNTDPTLATPENPEKHLYSTRTTYLGVPNQTADTAILRSQQVDSPLVLATGAASDPTEEVPDPDPDPPGTPGRTNWVGLKVSATPKKAKARVGITKTFKVTVRNIGDLVGKNLKVCPVVKDKLVRSSNCKTMKRLKAGRAGRFKFRATARRAAKGKKVQLKFRAKASRSKARSARVMLTIPFGR
ncbi:MAG: hypothetical protein ACSLFI_11580 [Solirubrobacterales bacterium]